jgi:hypothetical protein
MVMVRPIIRRSVIVPHSVRRLPSEVVVAAVWLGSRIEPGGLPMAGVPTLAQKLEFDCGA